MGWIYVLGIFSAVGITSQMYQKFNLTI